MAVLSSGEVISRLQDKKYDKRRLVISPILDWRRQISGGSVDIRLDGQFIVIKKNQFLGLDPVEKEKIQSEIRQYQERINVPFGSKFILHPNEFVLGSSLEYLSFPNDLMAYVIGRSSWGRLGLIIATATAVNPGFKGNLTLELVNLGNVPIVLRPGQRIAQLVIHSLTSEDFSNGEKKYSVSIGPGFSKIHEDSEMRLFENYKPFFTIGITGHKGSGKSVVNNYLVEERFFYYYSLSNIVRAETKKRGKSVIRNNLQNMGDMLRRQYGNDYLAKRIVQQIQTKGKDNDRVLIDGIRNPGEIDFLRKLPNFLMIGIIPTEKGEPDKKIENILKKRLLEKGYIIKNNKKITIDGKKEKEKRIKSGLYITGEEFKNNLFRDRGLREKDRDNSGQNIDQCLKKCDLCLVNNKTTVDLIVKLDEVLKKHVGE